MPPKVIAIRSSSHALETTGYAQASFTGTVHAVDSASWVRGYSWVVDRIPGTVPDGVPESIGATASVTASVTAPGKWYLHVRAIDAAGNAGPVARRTIVVAPSTATIVVAPSTATITVPKIVVAGYRATSKVTASLKSLASTGTPAAPLDGHTLLVQKRAGTVWSTIATMSASGVVGSYAATLPAVWNATAMRVELVDNALYKAVPATFTLKPRARLSTPVASTSAPRASRAFSMKGTLLPKHAGVVSVTAYRVSGTRLVRVSTKAVTATSTGGYKAAFKLKAGVYRFQATHSDAGHALTKSALSLKVRVR